MLRGVWGVCGVWDMWRGAEGSVECGTWRVLRGMCGVWDVEGR